MTFQSALVPPIALRPDGLAELGRDAATLAPRGRALLVIDGALARNGLAARAAALLEAAGLAVATYDGIAGEPGIGEVREAAALARRSDLVVGIGGGSALDTAKIAAACARDPRDPLAFACAAAPLPGRGVPKILVPTTAGTGAESSSTAILRGGSGRKLWICGPQTKAERILLDPALSVTLPAAPTAFCGLDAFVHAFEAATNRHANRGAELYAHAALGLVARALPRAVAEPGSLDARADMALAACYAGVAIDNCGTAIAHNVSHALAALGPVNHGLATALAFEATLPWLLAEPAAATEAAARACGLARAAELPGFVSGMLDACGLERRLPAAFAGLSPAALAAEMRAPETAPMLRATAREVGQGDVERLAEAMLALAPALETAP
jgi:alcohol dehydrogenase class IV